MHIESLRDFCLSKEGASEELPFGPDTLVFKVNYKIFLLVGLNGPDLRFNVKCDPTRATELREEYACVLPGFHMNKKHWNTIVVDGSVDDRELRQWITDSYNLVAPKRKASK